MFGNFRCGPGIEIPKMNFLFLAVLNVGDPGKVITRTFEDIIEDKVPRSSSIMNGYLLDTFFSLSTSISCYGVLIPVLISVKIFVLNSVRDALEDLDCSSFLDI